MTDHNSSTPFPGFLDRVKNGLRNFGARVLVHVCALFASATIAVVIEPDAALNTGRFLSFFSGYLGLICLFSREMSRSLNWILPFSVGIAQTILLTAIGAPLHAALLAGGAQTWLQRAIQKKGHLGSEWLPLPVMLGSGLLLLSSNDISWQAMSQQLSLGVLSFAGLALGGWSINKVLAGKILRPLYFGRLNTALARFDKAFATKQLPAPMQHQLRGLITESRQYLQNFPSMTKEVETLVLSLETTSRQVESLAQRGTPNLWDATAGNTHNAILRNSNSLRAAIANMSFQTQGLENNKSFSLPPSIAEYQQIIETLLQKRSSLPSELQPCVETICRSATNILECVHDVPGKESAAGKFLNRYLKATQRIIDGYAKLSAQKASTENLKQEIARSKDLLSRLEAAFAAEHAFLLQSDISSLSAELGVLDSLLKMDGR